MTAAAGAATGLGRYRALLSAPYVPGLVVLAFLARIPTGMAALGFVLLVRGTGGSYADAGLVVAAYTIGTAVGQPLAGRRVDRLGQTRILLPRGVLYPALLAAVCAAAALDAPTAVLAALTAACGLVLPPMSACMRSLWPSLAPTEDLRSTAYALEAALQELFFLAGPLLLAVIATLVSPTAGVLTAATLGAVGTIGFALRPPVRAAGGERTIDGGSRLGALSSGGVRAIVAISACCGTAFGTVEVAMPAFAELHGNRALGGVALAAFSGGSLVGGLVTGTLPAGRPAIRLQLALLAFAGGLALPLLAGSIPVMTVLLFVAGLPIAPAFASAYGLVDDLAAPGMLAEAFAWIGTAVALGLAVGTAGGGALIDAEGVRAALLLAVAAALAAAAIVAPLRRSAAGAVEHGSLVAGDADRTAAGE